MPRKKKTRTNTIYKFQSTQVPWQIGDEMCDTILNPVPAFCRVTDDDIMLSAVAIPRINSNNCERKSEINLEANFVRKTNTFLKYNNNQSLYTLSACGRK